jgi:hypothetical protein
MRATIAVVIGHEAGKELAAKARDDARVERTEIL